MDDFTKKRFAKIASSFVDIYAEVSPEAAAKMVIDEGIPEKDYSVLRQFVSREFLSRGWTFDEVPETTKYVPEDFGDGYV